MPAAVPDGRLRPLDNSRFLSYNSEYRVREMNEFQKKLVSIFTSFCMMATANAPCMAASTFTEQEKFVLAPRSKLADPSDSKALLDQSLKFAALKSNCIPITKDTASKNPDFQNLMPRISAGLSAMLRLALDEGYTLHLSRGKPRRSLLRMGDCHYSSKYSDALRRIQHGRCSAAGGSR